MFGSCEWTGGRLHPALHSVIIRIGHDIISVFGPVSDCKTLDEVKTFIEENAAGVTVNPTKINGLDTLVYGSEEADSMSVLIGVGDAGFLRVICRPVKDAQMNKLYSYVAASIQQIEE